MNPTVQPVPLARHFCGYLLHRPVPPEWSYRVSTGFRVLANPVPARPAVPDTSKVPDAEESSAVEAEGEIGGLSGAN